jgi:hypothetical protein
MGLLAVLDTHKKGKEGAEIEYKLYSWGEIFPPFLGDRAHSTAARFILTQFPFKLFSSSTPYDDPLPQKLCLTFKAPHEVKKGTEHTTISGIFAHEIAKEFAAFLSLFSPAAGSLRKNSYGLTGCPSSRRAKYTSGHISRRGKGSKRLTQRKSTGF